MSAIDPVKIFIFSTFGVDIWKDCKSFGEFIIDLHYGSDQIFVVKS